MPRPLDRVLQKLIQPRSVGGNAVIRFASTVAATVLMAATGILVARTTGADGKGAVATISYLIALAGPLAALGLGDAAVVLVRRRGWSVDRAASTAVVPTVLLTLVVGAIVWFAASLFPDLDGAAGWSLPLVALGVVAVGLQRTLTGLGEAVGEIPFTSFAYVAFAAVSTVATFVLVTWARLDVPGAVVALVAGPAAAALILTLFLRRRGVRLWRRVSRRDLGQAARLGVPMDVAQTLQTLMSRADMLVVYLFLGVAGAGYYSVALTVGEVVRYAPGALAVAAFPAVAEESPESAHLLARRVTRTTGAAAIVGVVLLGVAVPWLLPALFGSGFTPSVTPALVLLVGGIAASLQWAICRVSAAVGRPGVLVWSYGTSLIAMLSFDLWLVPAYGITGAAVASVLGPTVGLGVAVRRARHVFAEPVTGNWLLPGREEFAVLLRFPSRIRTAVRQLIR